MNRQKINDRTLYIVQCILRVFAVLGILWHQIKRCNIAEPLDTTVDSKQNYIQCDSNFSFSCCVALCYKNVRKGHPLSYIVHLDTLSSAQRIEERFQNKMGVVTKSFSALIMSSLSLYMYPPHFPTQKHAQYSKG